jgi:hypothetical protein
MRLAKGGKRFVFIGGLLRNRVNSQMPDDL